MSNKRQTTLQISETIDNIVKKLAKEAECSATTIFCDGVNLLHHLIYRVPEGSEICYKKPDGQVVEMVIMYGHGDQIKPKGKPNSPL